MSELPGFLACALLSAILSLSIGLSHGLPANGLTKGSDVLKKFPLIDGHNDLPYTIYSVANNDLDKFPFEKNITGDPTWGKKGFSLSMTDLPRLKAGKVGAQFWVAYVDCKAQYKDALQLTLRQIDVIKRLIKKYSNDLGYVTAADDIEPTWRKGKIASMLVVEGGHSIDSSLAVLRLYHELGVRYLTLTHMCNTPWADASPMNETSVYNLTEFGKTVVWELNRLGIMVDLSHVSHNVMRDVLAVTKAPVIFSHSSAFSLCRNYRNVPDDVLLKVKKNNGIVMVNFYSEFVNCDTTREANLEDVVAHINYIRNYIGIDHVGIGADYNGVDTMPVGLEDVSGYPALFDRLYASKKGEPKWSRNDLEKLAGRNLIRVFKAVEGVRDSLVSELPYQNIISGAELKIAQQREGLTPGSCQTAIEWNAPK